jgi:hypothetical protein
MADMVVLVGYWVTVLIALRVTLSLFDMVVIHLVGITSQTRNRKNTVCNQSCICDDNG